MAPKPKPNPLIYRVRDRLRTKEQELTERQILKRITMGKLNGDEEISMPPYEQWHKLSAHPTFYDAFIKRIYEGEYIPPDGDIEVSDVSEATASKQKTHGGKKTKQLDSSASQSKIELDLGEADAGKTRQLPDENGGTSNDSFLRSLFSISVRKPIKEKELVVDLEGDPDEVHKIGTDLIKIDQNDDALPKVGAPMDHAGLPTEEESPEVVARRKKVAARRRAMMIAGVAMLLLLLFQMSKSGPPPPDLEPKTKVLAPIKDVVTDAATKEDRIRTLVEEGDRLYENDMPLFYLGAQELFNEALAFSEANPIILGRLAEATARLIPESTKDENLGAEVARLIGKGRATDPQYSQFYRAEALAALYEKRSDDARAAIDHATDSDPSNTENYLVKGEILHAAGDLLAAKEAFEEVIKANPASVRARYFIARVAAEQSNLQRAESEALGALKLNPIHSSSYLLLGQIALKKKKLKEAKQLLETGLGLAKFAPRDEIARGHVWRAQLMEELGQKEEAGRSYQLAHYYDNSIKELSKEKLSGLSLKDSHLLELASQSEYGRAYFTEQADILAGQKKFREAYLFLEASYLMEPTDGLGLVKLGELTEKMATSYDDFRTVVSFYQRAILRDPSLTKAYIKLGLLESEQYNLERAMKLLKQAEALSPQEADPYVALGKHYYRSKDYLNALEQFTKAFKINPSDSEILYYAGLLWLLARKDEKDALGYFYRSYMLNPNNYEALNEWLKLKVQFFEKTFAVKFVMNLLEQDPNNGNLYWALGEVYAANKEFRKAIGYYHKALDLDNRSAKIRMALGKSLEAVGEVDSAVAEYRLSSFLDRRNGEGFYRAADLLFKSKKYRDAEEVLNYLVSISPNYPGAHRYLAKIYQSARQQDRALASMQREVGNNPLNTKYRIEYAELLMEYGKLENAIKELTEVTNLPPVSKAPEFAFDKIRGYLLLSRAYRGLNQFDSAESSITLALETDKDDPELHRELGYVYHGQQRDKEAVRELNIYLSKNPNSPDAENIRNLIQNLEIQE